ncbi:hypothetical protein UCRPC4_g01686 [Phaeomoniella chlamydospora]|uniref:Uncharacterized protein n=1 Tax=Phaeomoniella chlamydospora TaxID=158046 RepID=A0A0G2HAK1_PHACM|nr:hypothetical protein UCRPC4_g01686 [Phaeomoniella chlamydospora]
MAAAREARIMGTASPSFKIRSTSQREDNNAFGSQFEEVERAIDNLVKSGKLYSSNGRPPMSGSGGGSRSYDLGVLADISGKSDRSMSPSTLSEEGRRELIARQHRALYGNEAPTFYQPGAFSEGDSAAHESSAGATSANAQRGSSPRVMDPFGVGPNSASTDAGAATTGGSSATQERTSSTSPTSAANNGAFGSFESAAPQNTSTSPTGGQSPTRQAQKAATAPIGTGMAPIGSRPQQQAPNPVLNKRSTTPLASPMTFGFGAADQNNATERSGSAASNPSANADKQNVGMAWGSGSGVWGKNSLGATSVWG